MKIAGIELAREAATMHKLPSINKEEDIDVYPTAKLIDLCYRMGLLSRPEWRRIHRSYEIRRDLEHEDDEYEAALEDCMYIFKTSIEIVLAKDPVEILNVKDVRQMVEETSLTLSTEFLENYEKAPNTRKLEICSFLINVASDMEKPDVVRANCYDLLTHFEPITPSTVKIDLASSIQTKIGKHGLDLKYAKIANAGGVLPYLKQSKIRDFFTSLWDRFKKVSPEWGAYSSHSAILEDLEDVGGLTYCPDDFIRAFTKWMTIAYIGEPGEQGYYGRNRKVFYSDTAAPIISRLMARPDSRVQSVLLDLANEKPVSALIKNPHINRRYQDLLDLAGVT